MTQLDDLIVAATCFFCSITNDDSSLEGGRSAYSEHMFEEMKCETFLTYLCLSVPFSCLQTHLVMML